MFRLLASLLSRLKSESPSPVIPDGWLAHDGSGCPLDDAARPALLLRSGTIMPAGHITATSWGSHWRWASTSKNPGDIVAYRPEPHSQEYWPE